MTKRLFTLVLCVCLLLTLSAVGVSAAETASDNTADTVSATLLPYTLSYGTTDGKTLSELTALSDEQLTDYRSSATAFTLESSTGLPCQVFEVDTSGVAGDSIVLTFGASTIENERLAMKALNVTTGEWDTLDTAVSNGYVCAEAALATYAAEGKMQVMATVDYVANGSNRMLWSTDQQHYTEFEDLNETYMKIHEYMAQEYENDNVIYVINTGDIVDDNPGSFAAAGQWKVADKAFAILDEAGVPYGIETGNHDVGDYPANNYLYYLQYFDESRYEGKAWYGGTADDNRCHYDLVTVGNADFLFLYIGYGLGGTTEVIDWANEVLAMYPHRNAVICTHQYLDPISLEQKGRAEIIHDAIVAQNDNVVMVLSGHYDGAAYKWRDADERNVLEVMADYQFVQVESEEYYADHKDPLHHIGSVPYCNGEGYIREILVEGNTVSMYAFSPVTNGETPFGARDDLSFEVNLLPSQRRVTTYQFAAATVGNGSDSLTAVKDDDGTITYVNESSTADTATALSITVDQPGLQTLIDKADAIKKSLYTKDSYSTMKDALKAAKSALEKGTDEEIAAAYTSLSIAVGALEEKHDAMDPDKLTTVAALNLDLRLWENVDGPASLDSARSSIDAEQLENGGFIAQASKYANNTWPALKTTEIITFTPEDGKVYLYLDVEAGSTWSCYPTVIQNMQQYSSRWNYAIEGSYRSDLDAGSGSYVGVYDITQALIDMGVDPTQEMTLCFSMNVVPGPVTVNSIKILTGEYPQGLSLETLMWVALIAVVVLAVAAVVFALLYTPKKPTPTASAVPAEADNTVSEADTAKNPADPSNSPPSSQA